MKKLIVGIVMLIMLTAGVFWWRIKYVPPSNLGQSLTPVLTTPSSLEDTEYPSEVQNMLDVAAGAYIAEPDFDALFLEDLHQIFVQEDVAMPEFQRLASHAPMILLGITKTYATGDCTVLEDLSQGIDSRSISRFCIQVRNMRSMTVSSRFVKNDTAGNVITYVRSGDIPLLPEGDKALPSGFADRFEGVQSMALMDLKVTVENADPVIHRFYLIDDGEVLKLLDLVKHIDGRLLFQGDIMAPPTLKDDSAPDTGGSAARIGELL